MSGSGGYYKYRCKYWLTYNCPNWVWVNNAPCAHCLADGRDSEDNLTLDQFRISREIYVPRLHNGFVQYSLFEVVAAGDADSCWAFKDIPIVPMPIATGPTAVTFGATDLSDGQRVLKAGTDMRMAVPVWSRARVLME